MRISDWSSDVCSSDLSNPLQELRNHRSCVLATSIRTKEPRSSVSTKHLHQSSGGLISGRVSRRNKFDKTTETVHKNYQIAIARRSEERRVGKECDSTCRSRGSPKP